MDISSQIADVKSPANLLYQTNFDGPTISEVLEIVKVGTGTAAKDATITEYGTAGSLKLTTSAAINDNIMIARTLPVDPTARFGHEIGVRLSGNTNNWKLQLGIEVFGGAGNNNVDVLGQVVLQNTPASGLIAFENLAGQNYPNFLSFPNPFTWDNAFSFLKMKYVIDTSDGVNYVADYFELNEERYPIGITQAMGSASPLNIQRVRFFVFLIANTAAVKTAWIGHWRMTVNEP